jgi:hypothetical protein
MQGSTVSRRKVVVASSVAIPVVDLLDAEAAKSNLTTSSLIRLFIHEGLERRGVVLPEEAATIVDDDATDNGTGEGK